jgi:hypothetical protein
VVVVADVLQTELAALVETATMQHPEPQEAMERLVLAAAAAADQTHLHLAMAGMAEPEQS